MKEENDKKMIEYREERITGKDIFDAAYDLIHCMWLYFKEHSTK